MSSVGRILGVKPLVFNDVGVDGGKLFTRNGVSSSVVLEKRLQQIAPGLKLAPCSDCVHPTPGLAGRSALWLAGVSDDLGFTQGLTQKVGRYLHERERGPLHGIATNTNEERTAVAKALLNYSKTEGGLEQLKKVGKYPTTYTVFDPETRFPAEAVQSVLTTGMWTASKDPYYPSSTAMLPMRVVDTNYALFPNAIEKKLAPFVSSPNLDKLASQGIDVRSALSDVEIGWIFHHEGLHNTLVDRYGIDKVNQHHDKIYRALEHLYLRNNHYQPQGGYSGNMTIDLRHVVAMETYGVTRNFLKQAVADLSSVAGSPKFNETLVKHLNGVPQDMRGEYEAWLRRELYRGGRYEPSKAHLIPN